MGTTQKRRNRWAARVLGGTAGRRPPPAGASSNCSWSRPTTRRPCHRRSCRADSRRTRTTPSRRRSSPTGPGPATVLDPNRPARYITLKECIAIALEQGNIGGPGRLQNLGFVNDQAAQFSGRAVGGTDAIRAFALDPAITGADIERSLSKFDARWITSMTWQKLDQPSPPQFLSFQRTGTTRQLQHHPGQAAADRRRRRHHVQHRLLEPVRPAVEPGSSSTRTVHPAAAVQLRAAAVAGCSGSRSTSSRRSTRAAS